MDYLAYLHKEPVVAKRLADQLHVPLEFFV